MGGVPSVGFFQRNPSPYLREQGRSEEMLAYDFMIYRNLLLEEVKSVNVR